MTERFGCERIIGCPSRRATEPSAAARYAVPCHSQNGWVQADPRSFASQHSSPSRLAGRSERADNSNPGDQHRFPGGTVGPAEHEGAPVQGAGQHKAAVVVDVRNHRNRIGLWIIHWLLLHLTPIVCRKPFLMYLKDFVYDENRKLDVNIANIYSNLYKIYTEYEKYIDLYKSNSTYIDNCIIVIKNNISNISLIDLDNTFLSNKVKTYIIR